MRLYWMFGYTERLFKGIVHPETKEVNDLNFSVCHTKVLFDLLPTEMKLTRCTAILCFFSFSYYSFLIDFLCCFEALNIINVE